MESRMEKYHEIDIDEFQRSKKNVNLYKEIYGNYDNFENLPIPDNINEIDMDNLKSLVNSRSSKRKEIVEEYFKDNDDDNNEINNENSADKKVYDINALLEMAKEENAKIKKEVPVNRNIPNYLANLESDKNTKEIISKHDRNADDDLPIVTEDVYATSQNSLEDESIKTSTLSLDILSDLKPTGNTLVSEPLRDEIDEIQSEKEFFSRELKFSKSDFAEENEDAFDEVGDHLYLKVFLIIVGLASVFTATFFVIKEYTNLF